MARCATNIRLTQSDERILRDWLEEARLQTKRAERARIILFAAEGRPTEWIAEQLGTRPARVSKWRTRFAKSGIEGLKDSQRSGKPARRDPASDQRILELLAAPAPAGRQTWTVPLLASAAGLEVGYVRRVLKGRGIQIRQAHTPALTGPTGLRHAWIAGLILSLPLQALAVYSGPAQVIGPAPWTESMTAWLGSLSGGAPDPHDRRFCRSAVVEHMNRLSDTARPGLVNVIYAAADQSAGLPILPNVSYHRVTDTASWLEQVAAWFTVLSEARSGSEPAGANSITACMRDVLGQSDPAQNRCLEWFCTIKRAGSRQAGANTLSGAALA